MSPLSPYTGNHDTLLTAPRRTGGKGFRLAAASLVLASVSVSSAQTVFSATERADAGQPVTITGDGFAPSVRLTARRFNADGSLGGAVSIPVNDQSAVGVVSQLPAGGAFGVYRIDAANLGSTGGSVLVNAPRVQWADAPAAQAGSIVRLIGRNLHPSSAPTTVRLVDATTGASSSATVSVAGDATVSFVVPAGVVTGHEYRVLLNSGLAGAASESAAPETLRIVAKTTDPFGLGTYWGGDFAPIAAKVYNLRSDPRLPLRASGNGKADDTPALQAAIDYAARMGGGTVYVPAGTYRVDNGNSIQWRSRVVLKGDGAGRTILQVGYRFTAKVAPPQGYGWAFKFEGAPTAGLTELTIRNLNANAAPNGVFYSPSTNLTTNRCFLKNVNFELNNGTTFHLHRIREAVVQGCRFTSTCLTRGAVDLSGARYLRFSGNTVDYRGCRLDLTLSYRLIADGNTVRMDNAYHVPGGVEVGGIETSYGQQILVSNNLVQGYGPAPTKNGDGELIMTQRSNVPDFWDAGTVASADSLSLSTSGKSWPANWISPYHDDLDRKFVAILRGKGAGQWRRVAGHGASALTIDRPWGVVPDSSSAYAVGSLIALQQTWTGNILQNGWHGLMHYGGGMDCLIADNRLADTGSIIVRSASENAPTDDGTLSQCIAWNMSVRNNTVFTTNTRTAACVSVSSFITPPVADQGLTGSFVLGVDVSNNTINGSRYLKSEAFAHSDGLEVIGVNERGLAVDPLANWGTILWNNGVTGAVDGLSLINVGGTTVNGVLDTSSATYNAHGI